MHHSSVCEKRNAEIRIQSMCSEPAIDMSLARIELNLRKIIIYIPGRANSQLHGSGRANNRLHGRGSCVIVDVPNIE